ncbi:MAG: LamG-like jellyroll fold domain-containing protein [Phycisphaeraceae bacterium]
MMKSMKCLMIAALALGTVTTVSGMRADAALVLKLDAANYSITAGVGTWTDTSGNNNHAKTPANVVNPPVVVPAIQAGATPSGAAALTFNPTSGTSSLRLQTILNSAAFTTSPTLTIVMVVKSDPSHGTNKAVTGKSDVPGGVALRINGLANNSDGHLDEGLTLTRVNQADITTQASVVDPLSYHVISMTVNNNDKIVFRVDGTQVKSQTIGSLPAFTGINLIGSADGGNGQQFYGSLAALYIYDTALDTTTLQGVESGLTTTYLVPEPATLGLMALGGLMMGGFRGRHHP